MPEHTITGSIVAIPLAEVRPDPEQHRKTFPLEYIQGLADSMRATGQTDPVEVTPLDPPEGEVRYQIVDGECRYRACVLAGRPTILAVVKDDLSPEARLLRQVTHNLQRLEVNAMEEARAYRQLIDLHVEAIIRAGDTEGLDLAKIEKEARAWAGRQLGKAPQRIAYYVALQELPDEVQTLIAKGALDVGHGHALLRLGEAAKATEHWEARAMQVSLARKAVAHGLTAERLTQLVAVHLGEVSQGALFGDEDMGGKDRLMARANTKAVLDRITDAVVDAIKRTWDDRQQHFKPQALAKGELEVAAQKLGGAVKTLQTITQQVEAALQTQAAREDLLTVETVSTLSLIGQQQFAA